MDDFFLGIDGTHDEIIILFDTASLAFGVHPDDRLAGLTGGLSIAGEVFHLHALAHALLAKVPIEQPLRLIGSRRTTVRPERYTDDHPAAAKSRQAIVQAQRRFHFPRVL